MYIHLIINCCSRIHIFNRLTIIQSPTIFFPNSVLHTSYQINFRYLMDLIQLKKSLLDYTKKKKRSVLVIGALGLTCYVAHRINNLPSVVKKKQRLLKLFGAIISITEMISDSAEAIGILSKDLKQFLQSDSDHIPQSFKQFSKITTSDEFSESLTRITRAFITGILRGYRPDTESSGSQGFSDRVIDKLFLDSGSGFASVIVGSLARNLVIALYSGGGEKEYSQNIPSWIEVDKYREIIGDWIRMFVSTAVTVYLEKTVNINTYDEIFSGMTNPKHDHRVKEMLVSVCNSAVETYIRTSNLDNSTYSKIDCEDNFRVNGIGTKFISATLRAKKSVDKERDMGWISKVYSTLAVPSNRRLVVDMTGILTFETIRSFLEFVFEKLSECMQRSVDVVQREVVDRGVEVVRYVSCRSCTIATICFSLCFHILNGPWILVQHEF